MSWKISGHEGVPGGMHEHPHGTRYTPGLDTRLRVKGIASRGPNKNEFVLGIPLPTPDAKMRHTEGMEIDWFLTHSAQAVFPMVKEYIDKYPIHVFAMEDRGKMVKPGNPDIAATWLKTADHVEITAVSVQQRLRTPMMTRKGRVDWVEVTST